MKLYYIIDHPDKIKNPDVYRLMQEACVARDIEFVPLAVDTFDFSENPADVLEKNSLVYRAATSDRAALFEALVLRPDVATLYLPPRFRGIEWGSTIAMKNAGLPIVPTVFGVSSAQQHLLEKYAEKLSGFPVILKAAGGSHGSSVVRIDSIESLRSVVGFVTDEKSAEFVLRQYIHNAEHIRLIAVNNKIIDAIRYLPQPGDFRTNAVAEPDVEVYERTAEREYIFEIAEKAATVRGYALGGIDILLDEQKQAFIAEVNAPCNFARSQMATGTDVAGQIIDYLLARRQSILDDAK